MRIRIIRERRGFGVVGDVLDVSPERAERWVQMGLAELIRDVLEAPKPRRGRPPKRKDA